MLGSAGRGKGRRHPMVTAAGARTEQRWSGSGRLAARLLLAAGAAVVLAWCWLATGRAIRGSEGFRLTALEVDGLRVVTGVEVLAATGLAQTDNVFAVDLRAMRQRLEQLPWVRRAVVARRPPDRLAIALVERRRVAWVNLGRIYGIDEEGVLLPGERTPGEEPGELNLPVISGLPPGEGALLPGTVVADSGLAQVLGWWRQASRADAEFCLNVSEIQPLPGNGIRLLLVGDGLEVRLPTEDVAERLRILRKLIKRVYRECPDPAYIDMRFAGQVVVGSKGQAVGSKEQNPG